HRSVEIFVPDPGDLNVVDVPNDVLARPKDAVGSLLLNAVDFDREPVLSAIAPVGRAVDGFRVAPEVLHHIKLKRNRMVGLGHPECRPETGTDRELCSYLEIAIQLRKRRFSRDQSSSVFAASGLRILRMRILVIYDREKTARQMERIDVIVGSVDQHIPG